MLSDAFLFWFLSFVIVAAGLGVVLFQSPVYSVLSLVMSMVGVSAIFITLGAYFIAGVQTIVYTGAVMVLFVLVLMLFNLNVELPAFSRGKVTGFFKIASVGILAGLLVGSIMFSLKAYKAEAVASADAQVEQMAAQAVMNAQDVATDSATKRLAENLFMKNILAFEALGVLLLVIAIGVVALSRSKGGTHARD